MAVVVVEHKYASNAGTTDVTSNNLGNARRKLIDLQVFMIIS
jgi:hypothetical protein